MRFPKVNDASHQIVFSRAGAASRNTNLYTYAYTSTVTDTISPYPNREHVSGTKSEIVLSLTVEEESVGAAKAATNSSKFYL